MVAVRRFGIYFKHQEKNVSGINLEVNIKFYFVSLRKSAVNVFYCSFFLFVIFEHIPYFI